MVRNLGKRRRRMGVDEKREDVRILDTRNFISRFSQIDSTTVNDERNLK